MFGFSNYSAESKYETGGAANEKISRLKAKMYSLVVDNSSVPKKAKSRNKNVVTTIRHSECKDVFLNNKCSRHSMNRNQGKNQEIGTYFIIL